MGGLLEDIIVNITVKVRAENDLALRRGTKSLTKNFSIGFSIQGRRTLYGKLSVDLESKFLFTRLRAIIYGFDAYLTYFVKLIMTILDTL